MEGGAAPGTQACNLDRGLYTRDTAGWCNAGETQLRHGDYTRDTAWMGNQGHSLDMRTTPGTQLGWITKDTA